MMVQKFGGGILATRGDVQRAARIVADTQPAAVVVSALRGVTDQLVGLLQKAANKQEFLGDLLVLQQRHAEMSRSRQVQEVFEELEKILTGVSRIGEYSDKLYAYVLSRGEYLSALILSEKTGYAFWPAENGIATKGNYLNGRCDFSLSSAPPLYSVVPGFYGINEKKEVCLFGRGGTDYSAAVIARLLNADRLEFWKNVDGFMSADPKVEPRAKLVGELSLEEASELSRFGAKILHPSAIEPLLGTRIVAEVKNVERPEKRGTVIANGKTTNHVAAITGRKGVAVVSVSGDEMVEAFGIASKILGRVADAGIAVDVIATAQANISFSVDEADVNKAVNALSDLEQFQVSKKSNLALVGIVGSGVKSSPAFAAKVFSSLAEAGISVEMISQGASEIDLSLVVREENYERAVQSIHGEFFSG